jgi:hypothetical protein
VDASIGLSWQRGRNDERRRRSFQITFARDDDSLPIRGLTLPFAHKPRNVATSNALRWNISLRPA